ncbi:MAG TPA: UDP-3-O-(3-hydroxymyristoyl)glucosamine N-acyltransferase [Planctomycetaceae bacterium]|nr:UDP-3-O-(3-hydroxymyristoyl)glucosamine N-acyltransferase [Planctomycetaceae bacterium]
MQMTLAEVAALVQGKLVGDPNTPISGAAPLDEAKPGDITLIDKAERSGRLAHTEASAAIAPLGARPEGIPVVQVEDVHQAFALVVSRFRPPRLMARPGLSPQAVVAPSAVLGSDVQIHPLATIGEDVWIGDRTTIHAGAHVMGGCRIGEDVTIFPGAVLYENTIVGPRCVIHAGAVLGAYGFGYVCEDGQHRLAPQLGNVVLEAEVEIGANSTIDRGTYGSTVIGEGTKIDNQVMVAHNCRIGKHNMICAQVGIAGSTTTGDYVVMAGQVGVRDHVRIGSRVVLGAMAGVINDIPDGARMVGIPATPEREQMVKQAALAKLPEMRRQLKQLQAMVNKLVAEGASCGKAPPGAAADTTRRKAG